MTRSPIELSTDSVWTAKNTDDDNDGCNGNYDGNFDDKNGQNIQVKIE